MTYPPDFWGPGLLAAPPAARARKSTDTGGWATGTTVYPALDVEAFDTGSFHAGAGIGFSISVAGIYLVVGGAAPEESNTATRRLAFVVANGVVQGYEQTIDNLGDWTVRRQLSVIDLWQYGAGDVMDGVGYVQDSGGTRTLYATADDSSVASIASMSF